MKPVAISFYALPLYYFLGSIRLSMNPGAEPVIAVTLPIGLRYASKDDRWRRGGAQVVELTGIEPAASALQGRRSPR